MPAEKLCAHCHLPVPANAPQGLCPACLLKAGLGAFMFSEESLNLLPPKKQTSKARTTLRDYELLGEIARGGMGIVFRARQISLNRIVAVKALLFGEFASDDFIARFRAEAQAVAGLQHPNIVAIHDIWEESGQHFFSMELVEGQTLSQIIKEGPLPAKRAARYAAIIARAIQHAHSHGVVHRDLKPSNVLIDLADHPRITDFGLAKRLGHPSQSISAGSVVGSPHYMSPEQTGQSGVVVGPASDIYSIGAMLYHMLTGRPPFVGENVEAVLAQTVSAEPVSPRLLNASVQRDLETICLKCLQKDPRRRYSSARDLADDLDRFLRDMPIHARPIGRIERTVRWCRRNPAPTATLVLLTAIAAGAISASQYFRNLNQQIRIGQYVSDMNVAMRHVEDGDNGHALALLKAHMPAGKNPDLRGFEWRYMWWLCRGNYDAWLPAHPQVVGGIQFASDGEKVLTYAWNTAARLWDAPARRNLLTITNVSAIAGFTRDEKAFVINRPDDSLQLIDAKTGATNRVIASAGQLVAYARQPEIVVTLDKQRRLKAWELNTGRELLTVSNAPPAKLEYSWNSRVVLSPDGSKLALIVPSPNPLFPARGVRVWNLLTSEEPFLLPENRELRCAAFSPDGKWLLTGDGSGNVRIWDLAASEYQQIPAHSMPVLAIAFSPDGQSFATGSSDTNSVRLWDFATRTPRENEFRGQAGDVWSLAFSPDGKRIASGTRDGLIRIWTIERALPTGKLDRLHSSEYPNIAFSPDSRMFAGGCANGVVKIWNVTTLKNIATIPNAAYVVAFSPDNQRLLVSTHEWRAFWWDIEKRTAEPLPTYGGKMTDVASVDISPNRRIAALGLSDGGIQLVDMTTGLPVGSLFKGHTGSVHSLAFSPDGEKLASGGADMNVMMWDVKSGLSLGMCQDHKAAVFGLAISPDGKTLASGCGAETVKLWDVNNVAGHAWASASYHRSAIRSLNFSPDKRTLASASEDRTVKLWNFASFSDSTSRREVASFTFEKPVRVVLFSPDGNVLAAVTDSGDVRLFHAFSLEESDRQFRELR